MGEINTKQDEQIKTLFVRVNKLETVVSELKEMDKDIVVIENKITRLEEVDNCVRNLDKNMALLLQSFEHMSEKEKARADKIDDILTSLSNQQEILSNQITMIANIERRVQEQDRRIVKLEDGDDKFRKDIRDGMSKDASAWLDTFGKFSPAILSVGIIIVSIVYTLSKFL